MEFDWKTGALAEGLACYGRAEFFEAHENWEECWRKAVGTEKALLQGLVQVAVSMCHFQRGNRVGAASLLHKSLARLGGLPDALGGVSVARLRAELRLWIEYLEKNSEGDAPPVPVIF